MSVTLYDLVQQSKSNEQSMQELLNMFEPKLKKSLILTHFQEREDLSQELRLRLIQYILKYNVESTPGFWDVKERLDKKRIS